MAESASKFPTQSRQRGLNRRDFVKWTAMAGASGTLAGMGVLSALGIVRGPQEPVPEWELEAGVVDYSAVPEAPSGPTPNVLKVAQWYDYWPGKFLVDFEAYMRDVHGVTVRVQWDVYTSNEELFTLITLGKRRYDVIFPSNYMVDLLKKANMIYTLNDAWLPNLGPDFGNMHPDLVNVPRDNPYDRRKVGGGWRWVSTPYFWGTTGIGFRTDRIPRDEMMALGYDLMWLPSYTPTAAGYTTLDLRQKMRMLDDMRDVVGAGLKKAGWETQKAEGRQPTGAFPPDGPQWTTNEADPARIRAAGDWLFRQKPLLFGYNSTDQAGSLIGNSPFSFVNQAWSGDMMYAIRPDAQTRQPVDYIIPPQGSTWWVDCGAIHSKSRNLWLAHEFLNFIHSTTKPWDVQQQLTIWNLYSTPNKITFDELMTFEFQSGWIMSEDRRLYPNIYAPEDFRICDLAQDVGLRTLQTLYNPLWFELVTE